MISIEEVNLWLMSNRMCVMPIATHNTYCRRLTEAQVKLHKLEPKLRRLEAMKLGGLAEQNKLLKKNLRRSKQRLGRLRTLSLLARLKSWNSNTQPQTP
jgi:hypothetical protein